MSQVLVLSVLIRPVVDRPLFAHPACAIIRSGLLLMPESIHSPVLIGRTHELEILDRALGAVQKGAGRCILLAGEPGIGKSRVAAEVRDHATAARFVILRGALLRTRPLLSIRALD